MKLIPLIALLAAVPLCSCEQQANGQTPATAKPAAMGAVAASAGRLVLPAVKGRPGAAYLTLANRGTAAVTVVSLSIDRAGRAEIHRTQGGTMTPVERLEVAPGTSARFKPGGLHVMVFGLDPKLQAGGKAELTVTFANGKTLKTPLAVVPPGGAMEGMDHGDMH